METTFTYEGFLQWWGSFFWPMIRVGAFLFLMPVISSRAIPTRIKLIIVLVLTFTIAPSVEMTHGIDPFSNEGVWMAMEQAGIGLAMGLVFLVVFQAFVLAGQMMANSMGLGFASLVDPVTGVNSPVTAQLHTVIISLLFVVLNGHLMIVQLLIDSFQQMPLNGRFLSTLTLKAIVDWTSYLFVWAMMLSLPIVTALLLVNISLGVVSKAAPTLNIFSIGFVITILGGMLLMWWLLPQLILKFQWFMNASFDFVRQFELSQP